MALRKRTRRNYNANMKTAFCVVIVLGLFAHAQADMDWLEVENQGAVSTTYMADSPAAAELLEESERLLREQQYVAAVESLQQIVKDYGGRLLQDESGRYVDAREQAWLVLLSSAELIEQYERRYGSIARRELERATRPMIDEQALTALFQRYAMTQAGLDATLHRAALQLQRGHFDHADLLLRFAERHPGMTNAESKRRLSQMQAFVAAARGQDDVAVYVERFIEAGGRGAEQLRQVLAGVKARSMSLNQAMASLWPRDQVAPSLSRPSWQRSASLWKSQDDTDSDQQRQNPVQQRVFLQMQVPRQQGGGPAGAVTVTPADQTLLIHNALGLSAWDRSSGRPRWSHLSDLPSHVSRMPQSRLEDQLMMLTADAPLADEGVVYAMMDWNGGMRGMYGGGFNSLAAYDVSKGRELWRTASHEIDPSLATATFRGTPLKQSERLFALLSRTQSGGFQELYLVALNPVNGEAIWHRHIASSSLAGMAVLSRSPESLLNGSGRLFVSNGRGVVASVSAMDGALLWAQLFKVDTVPLNDNRGNMFRVMRGQQTATKSNLSPVLIESGLVVPVQWRTDERPLMRLDPYDGTVLDEKLAIREGAVVAMDQFENDLILLQLDNGLTRYDGTTLEPVWQLPLEHVTTASSLNVLGHVAAVAMPDRVLMVDLNDGSILEQRAVTMMADVALSPGQLILIQRDAVSSFMAWDLALQQLTAQMTRHPEDPNPGLALARMAFNEGQPEQLEAGLDHAVASLAMGSERGRETLREQVFADLMELGRDSSLSEQTAMADVIYRRLGEIVHTSQQRVEQLMDHGEHLARSDRLVEAVAAYQQILLADELTQQTIRADQLVRPAGLMAQQRLEKLVKDHGRDIYEKFETQAVAELVTARASGDLDELIAVSDRYPVSMAAIDALASAGDLLVERDELSMASEYYRQAIRLEPEVSVVRSLASRMIRVYEQAGQTRQAAYWLRRLDRKYPGLTLMRDESQTTPKQWLATLSQNEPTQRTPVVTLPLKPAKPLQGELMQPQIRMVQQTVQPGFMLREGRTLHYHRGSDGQRLWSVQRPQAQLLLMDQAQILLYSPSLDAIEALNPGTGRPVWPAVKVGESMEAVAPLREQIRDDDDPRQAEIQARIIINNRPGGGRVEVVEDGMDSGEGLELVFAAGPLNLAVADRLGRVMMLDRMSGEVRWRKATSIHLPLSLAMSEDQVAVVGSVDLRAVQRWRDVRGGVGQLQLIDGEGGVVILGLDHGDEQMAARQRSAPFYAAFHAEGHLVTVASQDIFTYATTQQNILWHLDCSDNMLGPEAWLYGDQLLAMERQGSMSLFDVTDGRWIRRLSLQSEGRISSAGIEVTVREDQWVLCMPKRLLVMDMNGQVRWKDGLHRDKDTSVATMLVSASHVFLMQLQQGVGEASSQQGMILNLETGRIQETFDMPGSPRLRVDAQGFAQSAYAHAMFVENAVVFGTGDKTLYSQGSPDPSSPTGDME